LAASRLGRDVRSYGLLGEIALAATKS